MTDDKSMPTEKAKVKSDRKSDLPAESRVRFSQVSEFTAEVKSEFLKIAWPNKKTTAGSAMLVVVLVTLMSLYLGAVDLFLGKLISYILK